MSYIIALKVVKLPDIRQSTQQAVETSRTAGVEIQSLHLKTYLRGETESTFATSAKG